MIEVAGAAPNGRLALQKLAQGSVDVVTLDMEMPEMGGIETLKEIRKARFPVRVVIFSSHTRRGSEAALEALSAGADDFVTKPAGDDSLFRSTGEKIAHELLPKILQFAAGEAKGGPEALKARPREETSPYIKRDLVTMRPAAVVIGSSTGGPPALEKLLVGLQVPLRIPMFIVQHMPPVFTASLSKRLSELSGLPVREGVHGEVVQSNGVYVAPGDYHMTLKKIGSEVRIQLDQGVPRNSVRPAADNLFESAAEVYGSKCLGIVLTGMGEDGRLGCRQIKSAGGGVMIQDKASCVVFGMPGAVFADGAFDEIGEIEKLREILRRLTA